MWALIKKMYGGVSLQIKIDFNLRCVGKGAASSLSKQKISIIHPSFIFITDTFIIGCSSWDVHIAF